MFALVTRSPRLRANRLRYNLTQSRPFFESTLTRSSALPSKTLYFFHIVKEQLRTSLPKGPAKSQKQTPYACFCLLRLAVTCSLTGGADRDRTDDPLLAKQVLSQLSYSPIGSAIED